MTGTITALSTNLSTQLSLAVADHADHGPWRDDDGPPFWPLFPLLWLLVMLLPTILSGDAPHFGRMTGAAPVIAIFIGLGAEWVSGQYSVNRLRLMQYFCLLHHCLLPKDAMNRRGMNKTR